MLLPKFRWSLRLAAHLMPPPIKLPMMLVLGLSGLAGAVLFSFLDTDLGWDMPSAALFVSIFV